MDKLRALQYFVAAAQEGSFSGAARRFEVSLPAVSKLVGALERSLGASLFERSTHGLALTADGARYLDSCRSMLEQLGDADDAIGAAAGRPRGVLTVGAPAFVLKHCLGAALPRFHSRFPDIELDLRIVSRLTDTHADNVDVFVLFGWHDAPDMVQKRIAQTRYHVTAAPAYWAAHGVPERPLDLARHTCLCFRNPEGTLLDLWEFEREGKAEAVTVKGWLASAHRDILLDAAIAGEGVLRVTGLTSWHQVRSGLLVPALRDWAPLHSPPVQLLYRPRHRRTPRVRAFIDFAVDLFRVLQDERESGPSVAARARPEWQFQHYGRASSATRRR